MGAKMAGKDLTAMKPFHACASAHLGNALMVRTRSIAPTALTNFLDENVNTIAVLVEMMKSATKLLIQMAMSYLRDVLSNLFQFVKPPAISVSWLRMHRLSQRRLLFYLQKCSQQKLSRKTVSME